MGWLPVAAIATGLSGAVNALVNASNARRQQQTSLATAPISNSSSLGMSAQASSGASYSQGYSEGYTAGKEASQADIIRAREANQAEILRAREANEMQLKMANMQMDYNSAQARLAREWEEYMSNTSYQRAVEDLAKAGLNPILAAGNLGASTPTAVAASSGMATAQKAQTYKANTFAESRSMSTNSGGSTQSSKGASVERSKSKSQPSYIAAGGSTAEALANVINAGSASTAAIQKQFGAAGPTEEELIRAAWGEG